MFELNVISNTPLGAMTDIDTVAETFLVQIGYIPKGYDPKTDAAGVRESVPYRLFMDFFMRNATKIWTVEELAALMRTTKPTIYRHINKLKAMDILEGADVEFDGQMRKGYRIRYGDLRKAWSFTEANVNMAMENYRKTVAHFQALADEELKRRV
ncbi:MAG: helix-turn-helix domain-containing protein [Methanomassiliicoccaceae archaeon]|jgi:DNA-binding transcriptional ArsR family regulator|nr:helix-turn-helix domain-containing protein [Methanomassiliicoccaceae archaeon]